MKIDSIDHLVLTVRDSLSISDMNRRTVGADFSRLPPNRVARHGSTLALPEAVALA